MTEQEKMAMVLFRIAKAKETLAEVDILLENQLFNTAMSRLYYACFYAVNALMLQNDTPTKTHSGTKQQFNLHFVHKGVIEESIAVVYARIFNKRQQGDYEDFIVYTDEDVRNFIAPITTFISKIEELLN